MVSATIIIIKSQYTAVVKPLKIPAKRIANKVGKYPKDPIANTMAAKKLEIRAKVNSHLRLVSLSKQLKLIKVKKAVKAEAKFKVEKSSSPPKAYLNKQSLTLSEIPAPTKKHKATAIKTKNCWFLVMTVKASANLKSTVLAKWQFCSVHLQVTSADSIAKSPPNRAKRRYPKPSEPLPKR